MPLCGKTQYLTISQLQLSYGVAEKLVVSTEFENMHYKQPGFYSLLPTDMSDVNVYENNFSLVLKYLLVNRSKFRVMVGSGWTYCTRVNDFYITSTGNGSLLSIEKRQYGLNDYRIPLCTEVEYPVLKTLNLQLRGRYSLNIQDGNTYSVGLGASIIKNQCHLNSSQD